MHSTHHVVDGGLVILTEHDDLHHLACAGGARHRHADEALLPADVVKGIAPLDTVIADEQAQLVADVVLQPAALDVQHLVKGPWNVETRRIAVGELLAAVELLTREPALVAEGEFQLVAVMGGHRRAQNRVDGGDGHLGNALHRVHHLLLLALQLVFVWQMLPLAAATQPEVLTHRFHTQLAGLHQTLDMPLGIAVLLAVDFQVNHVARSAIRDKHHQVVPAAQALALGRHARYLKILNYRNIFLLSHNRPQRYKKQRNATTRFKNNLINLNNYAYCSTDYKRKTSPIVKVKHRACCSFTR